MIFGTIGYPASKIQILFKPICWWSETPLPPLPFQYPKKLPILLGVGLNSIRKRTFPYESIRAAGSGSSVMDLDVVIAAFPLPVPLSLQKKH